MLDTSQKRLLEISNSLYHNSQELNRVQRSGGTAQELNEFTATLQRTISSKLISRLEFRRDSTDSRTFFRGPDGQGVAGQNTVALGLIYAFSSADAK